MSDHVSQRLRITVLTSAADERGSSYTATGEWASFLGTTEDLHITHTLPGHVRGNHFHAARHEVLVVLYEDAWTVAWDAGEGTSVTRQHFAGKGSVLIEVAPLAAHAIANTGAAPLWIVGMSSAPFDPRTPDSFPRQVYPLDAST